MIILLIAHCVDHAVSIGIVSHSLCGSSDVLGHINRGSITAQNNFVVQAFIG